MKNSLRRQNQAQQQATGGPAAIITGRPTLAGNVPHGLESRFESAAPNEAEFLRLPKPGQRCPLTQLSRTGIIELGEAGLIKLARVRRPGTTRGCVLVVKQSLLDYLHGLADKQQGEAKEALASHED